MSWAYHYRWQQGRGEIKWTVFKQDLLFQVKEYNLFEHGRFKERAKSGSFRRDMGQHLLEMKRHVLPNDCNETKAAFDDIISKQKARLGLNAQLVNHLV